MNKAGGDAGKDILGKQKGRKVQAALKKGVNGPVSAAHSVNQLGTALPEHLNPLAKPVFLTALPYRFIC